MKNRRRNPIRNPSLVGVGAGAVVGGATAAVLLKEGVVGRGSSTAPIGALQLGILGGAFLGGLIGATYGVSRDVKAKDYG